jgi:hypothetical protein
MNTTPTNSQSRRDLLKLSAGILAAAALGGTRLMAQNPVASGPASAIEKQMAQAQTTTINYTVDVGVIANPERGFWSFNSNDFGAQGLPLPLSDMISSVNKLRSSRGTTTIVCTYGLSAWKTTIQLPQHVLNLIDADFTTARKNGYKLIPRFSYCDPQSHPDATASIMTGHIIQLKPIFISNVDVMALGGLGMYGHWGEQWGTANTTGRRLFEINDKTKAIFAAMLDAVPTNRMIMMRYAWTMRQLIGDVPCPENEAFTGTARSRVGHYNDCFLAEGSSEKDLDQGPWSYTSVQGAYTPDLAVDMSCAKNYTDQLILENLDKQHFDFASLDNGKVSSAALQTIDKYIGYRYRLVKAVIQNEANAGGNLSVNIEITNDGYGNIFNARKVEIIFRNQSNKKQYVTNIEGDKVGNRKYFPYSHATTTWNLSIATTGVPAGKYDVLLNLPDPYASIHDNPAYSIRLANQNTWEPITGYNKLLKTISVN